MSQLKVLPSIGMIAFTLIFGVVTFLINKKNEALNNKAVLYLALFTSIFISLTAFLGLIKSVSPLYIFISTQLLMLIYGCIYAYIIRKYYYPKINELLIIEIFLTLTIVCLGALGYTLIFANFGIHGFGLYFTSAVIPFIVPLLFMKCFDYLILIPTPIYKVWYYPDFPEEPDLDKLDLNRIFVLELEFSKVPFQQNTSNFKLKAPFEMNFGIWFQMFIDNYNDKFQDSQIQYMDTTGRPYGWIFYTKPSFWKPKRYIDPDITIVNNKVKENLTIVSLRVEENK